MLKIRPATDPDHDAIWEIFREVIAAGETYPLEANTPREEALAYWFQRDAHVYVAENENGVVGAYTLHANQSGGGAHVANAGFIVERSQRRQGVGRGMAEHCLAEARRLGFRALQFNFVISTNESAVRLWQEVGMKIIGTLPAAFRHPSKGYVDVYVMHRSLI